MKAIIIFSLMTLYAYAAFSRQDSLKVSKPSWFDTHVKIRQSMETAEFKEMPAQFQVTLPKADSSSWLVNVGVSLALNSGSSRWLSSLITEYHKNTLTELEQHNMQAAYGFSGLIAQGSKTAWFLNGDAGYVYDEVGSTHSLAGNFLFTFMRNNGPINTYKFANDTSSRFYLSPFLGIQLQEIMQAPHASHQGFLMRPVFTLSAYYDLIRQKTLTPEPFLRLSADYTGRSDLINSTALEEGYTQLLQTGLEWFLVNKPFRISLGASFNYGSDPLRGLAQQQYWLLSFNFYK